MLDFASEFVSGDIFVFNSDEDYNGFWYSPIDALARLHKSSDAIAHYSEQIERTSGWAREAAEDSLDTAIAESQQLLDALEAYQI